MQGMEPVANPRVQRPCDPKDVLVLIKGDEVFVSGLDGAWVQKVMKCVGNGEIHCEEKRGGVILRSSYGGSVQDRSGKIVVRHRGDDRFKLVAIEDTPNSLLKDCADLLGESLEPEECGRHGLVFRGTLRREKSAESLTPALAMKEDLSQIAVTTVSRPRAPIKEVRNKLRQKTVIIKKQNKRDFSANGPKAECKTLCDKIAKPGARYEPAALNFEVNGTLAPAFLEESDKNLVPDGNGTIIRTDGKTISAFGDHLECVNEIIEKRCKPGKFLVVLIGKNDDDYRIVGSGELLVKN